MGTSPTSLLLVTLGFHHSPLSKDPVQIAESTFGSKGQVCSSGLRKLVSSYLLLPHCQRRHGWETGEACGSAQVGQEGYRG